MGIKQIIGGEVKKQIANALYTQETEVEGFNPVVQPIIDVNQDYINVVKSAAVAAGATGTIYTTPTTKDFYLTNIFNGQGVYDAYLSFTIGGETVQWGKSSTSVVYADTTFGRPIKIDRGTNITVTAGATQPSRASIAGFTRESFNKK